MFSRPLPPFNIENAFIEPERMLNKTSLKTVIPNNILKSSDFFKQKMILEKYKIAELKNILKFYKTTVNFSRENFYTQQQIRSIKNKYDFSLNGKKEDLISRVKTF